MTHSLADSVLADAQWWFFGYAAGLDPKDTGNPAHNVAPRLRAARKWLNGLAHGDTRLVGQGEHFGVVLREGEFEQIVDALTGNTPADIERGRAVAARIYEVFTAERRDYANAQNEEIPF